jgi:GAF domain-containing protein
LYAHVTKQARLVVSHVSSPELDFLLKDVSLPLGDRLTGWVGANRQMILNSDPGLDLGEMAEAWTPRLRSCFAMPLVSGDALLGVLSVYSPDQEGLTRRQTRMISMLVSEGLERSADRDFEPVAEPASPSTPRPRSIPRRRRRGVSVPA